MTPVWHDGPLATLAPTGAPVAWSVTIRTDPGVAARAEDLADATRGDDGTARLTRRRLVRALVARLAHCPPQAVSIVRDLHGAPRVESPDGWHVSLSGRGDRALIGVARAPIGVDREPLDGQDPLWDMLTRREAETLRALPEADRADAWLCRWTIKEAHAKLVGEPRRIAAEAIETRLDAAGHGGARFEGHSDTRTRIAHDGVETIAMWRAPGSADRA